MQYIFLNVQYMVTYWQSKLLTIGEIGDMATLRGFLAICEISVPIHQFHAFLYPPECLLLLFEH